MNFERNEPKRPLTNHQAGAEIPPFLRPGAERQRSRQQETKGVAGRVAREALDILPFDGDKTKIGALGIGTSLLGLPIPVDPTTWIITSIASFGLGLLHKWLKKNYPEVKLPYQ